MNDMAKVGLQLEVNAINPLNAQLNPICHLLALLGAHTILHVSRIRVNWVLLNKVNVCVCASLCH